MPWSLATVKEQREEFVQLARQPQANISELCRRFGISRKTGYKWLGREDLEDRSRRPQTSPRRTLAEQESQGVAMRAAHPAWGARKIAHVLARDHGVISYKNRRMRVGKALMGQHVALRRRPGCDDVFDVYFGPHRLKTRTLVQNQ